MLFSYGPLRNKVEFFEITRNGVDVNYGDEKNVIPCILLPEGYTS